MAITQEQYDKAMKQYGSSDAVLAAIKAKDKTGKGANQWLAYKPTTPVSTNTGVVGGIITTDKKKDNKIVTTPPKLPVANSDNLNTGISSPGNPNVGDINKTFGDIQDTMNQTQKDKESIINESANKMADLIAKKNAGRISAAEQRQLDRIQATNAYTSSQEKIIGDVEANVAGQKSIAENEAAIGRSRMLTGIGTGVSERDRESIGTGVAQKFASGISAAEQYGIDKKSAIEDKKLSAKNLLIDNAEETDRLLSGLSDEEYAPYKKAMEDVQTGKTGAKDKLETMLLELQKKRLEDQGVSVLASESRVRQEKEWNDPKTDKLNVMKDYAKEATPYINDFIKKNPNWKTMTFSEMQTGLENEMKNQLLLSNNIGEYLKIKAQKPEFSIPEFENAIKNMGVSGSTTTVTDTGTPNKKNLPSKNGVPTKPTQSAIDNKNIPITSKEELNKITNPIEQAKKGIAFTDQGEANKAAAHFDVKGNKDIGTIIYPGGGKIEFYGDGTYSYFAKGNTVGTRPVPRKTAPKIETIDDVIAKGGKIEDLATLLQKKGGQYTGIKLVGKNIYGFKDGKPMKWSMSDNNKIIPKEINQSEYLLNTNIKTSDIPSGPFDSKFSVGGIASGIIDKFGNNINNYSK